MVATTLSDVVTEAAPERQPFTTARAHFWEGVTARRDMLQLWNKRFDYDSFTLFPETPSPGALEVWVRDEMPADARRELDEAGRKFLFAVKAALDSALFEAATLESSALWPVPAAQHTMPLCETEREFDDLLDSGHLDGLRPDQVTDVRAIQPFRDADSHDHVAPRLLLHLRRALEQALTPGELLTGTWVSSEPLEYRIPEGATITEESSDESGFFISERRLGSCLISPTFTTDEVDFISHSPLDLIFNADPWPRDCDDNLSNRTQELLELTAAFGRHLEKSGMESTLAKRLGNLDNDLPVMSQSPWLPVRIKDNEQETEIREGLREDCANLATYRDSRGALILIKVVEGRILGREIPQAAVPDWTSEGFGADVEATTLHVAKHFALPDFILSPTVIKKGTASREVGDGTILAGKLGLAVQVKAREAEPGDPERETNWLKKNARAALKQARGTIRTTLLEPNLRFKNLRGRAIRLQGRAVTWVPVAVLDHPAPPAEVTFDESDIGVGIVLLRRDWDFLWFQLKSAAAVVDYLHRVLPLGNVTLGEETARYHELAEADERTDPSPSKLTAALGGLMIHAPKLPQEPAGSDDQIGHDVFRQLLEDIATSPLDGNEESRLEILGLIDRTHAGQRAQLGRLLLRRLDRCATVEPGTLLSQNRIFLVDDGRLQLVFSVYSSLTGYIRDTYRSWLLVRRQDYLKAAEVVGDQLPWTVGILLTPSPDRHRLWDTTVMATNSKPAFSAEEYAELRRVFASIGIADPPVV